MNHGRTDAVALTALATLTGPSGSGTARRANRVERSRLTLAAAAAAPPCPSRCEAAGEIHLHHSQLTWPLLLNSMGADVAKCEIGSQSFSHLTLNTRLKKLPLSGPQAQMELMLGSSECST